MNIVLIRNMALGNGDRRDGEILGTVDKDPGELVNVAWECTTLAEFNKRTKLKVEASEGVADTEILTVFRNPTIWAFNGTKKAKPTVAAGDPDAEPGSVESLGLKPATTEKLKAAGINTVDELADFASENDGLQAIDGVGPSAEKEIAAAINAIAD